MISWPSLTDGIFLGPSADSSPCRFQKQLKRTSRGKRLFLAIKMRKARLASATQLAMKLREEILDASEDSLRHSCFSLLGFGCAFLLCASLTVSAQVVPLAQHVVLVVDENTSFNTVYPNGMPWLVSEGKKYGYANNYYSDVSGSLLDYLYLASGSCEKCEWRSNPCSSAAPGDSSADDPAAQRQRRRGPDGCRCL